MKNTLKKVAIIHYATSKKSIIQLQEFMTDKSNICAFHMLRDPSIVKSELKSAS